MLRGSILQQLVDSSHDRPSQTPFNYGVYYKNTLVSLCHALEDSILDRAADDPTHRPIVLTAFQRGKWYLQEADRYGTIAANAQQIVILGTADTGFTEHPTSQRDNVAIVSLDPDDPVAQEWHLVIVSPSYTAMVMCQELSAADYGSGGVPTVDVERKFYGFWTFEPDLVLQTARLMLACSDRYDLTLRQRLEPQLNEIAAALHIQDTTEHLTEIVSRVVRYLRDRQATLPDLAHLFQNEQALDRNLAANELQAFLRMAQAIDLSDTANPLAGSEVAALCEAMGALLDLPAWQVKRLRLAGLLHRIDYLPGTGQPLAIGNSQDAPSCALACPLPAGAQALRMMPKLRAIAQIVNHRTEHWDGSGTPGSLAADAIPLESRILGLLAEFQQVATRCTRNDGDANQAIVTALVHCQAASGTRWDPKLVEMLGLLVAGLQQGMSLPIGEFKLSSTFL